MRARSFPEANGTFRRPEGWTEEECHALEVHDTGEAFISCWSPSEEDRRRIAEGKPIYLSIVGRGHPPVSLQTENPFAGGGAEPLPLQLSEVESLILPALHKLAGAASLAWSPPPSGQVFDAEEALRCARNAAMEAAALVQEHVAVVREGLQVDAKLGRELVALLAPHAGERGPSEGAVDVLRRLIDENAAGKLREGCRHPRRKTMMEDGRTDCTDCGVSITPLFWAGQEHLQNRGAAKIVERPDAMPVRRPLGEVKVTRPIAMDVGALEERGRAKAEGPSAKPSEKPWLDEEDLL